MTGKEQLDDLTLNLYESPVLRTVTGPVIRPGGFGLTDRGLSRCLLEPGSRVLDIGCGAGAVVDHLRRQYGLDTIGIDLSAVLLKEGALSYGGLPLARGRAEQLPIPDGAFEAVVCECMLSLCPEPRAVLDEIRRVLQPGGFLILTDVYARSPGDAGWMGKVSVQCCLQGAVDRATVVSRVEDAGLELLLWEDHSSLLKQLAAQLIWTYGSLDAFWTALGRADGTEDMHQKENTCRSRPGYYVAVARK